MSVSIPLTMSDYRPAVLALVGLAMQTDKASCLRIAPAGDI